MKTTIVINVDLDLLKNQVATLNLVSIGNKDPRQKDHLNGIWEMCHCIIDEGEK